MGDPTPDSVSLNPFPLGWHPRWGFAWHFPPVELPLVAGERRSFGRPDLKPNRLFLGDNLQVMRSLPDASIDLITVDPPFFSGHNYAARKSTTGLKPGSGKPGSSGTPGAGFSDIWEGGLAEYLIWLNARLYEMKRLLKPNGTLYIHLDYHAAHYVKIELDKLFGYGHMLNEIVWHMNSGQRRAHAFGPRHNLILRYSLSDTPTFNARAVREPYSPDINVPSSKARYYHPDGKVADDVWRIPIIPQNDRRERTGYPTQKPEALLERMILASSNPGDIIADFFCGSGTALVVAQRLERRWIGCDLAPEAIKVTLARLTREEQERGGIPPAQVPDVALSYAGPYPMPEADNAAAIRSTIVEAWGGRVRDEEPIHGAKGREALHVGAVQREQPLSEAELRAFVQALQASGWRRGTLLAETFELGARHAAERLALAALTRGTSPDSGRVHLDLVGLECTPGPMGPLVTFILPPRIRLRFRHSAALFYRFSAIDSVAMNPGARIDRVGWEVEAEDGGAADADITLEDPVGSRAGCRFARPGRYWVLCRVRDDRGGEAFAWRGLDAY